jgi:hypothetical protein
MASVTSIVRLIVAISASATLLHCQGLRISPRVRSEFDLGSTTIQIEYGRPAVKGRKIFGGLVPYGQLWRTGADETTVLTSTSTLTVGTLSVPPGSYSLFTIPGKDVWTLIVNTVAEQLGIDTYNRKKDLGRVEMRVAPVEEPIERLTITVEKIGNNNGILRVGWQKTVASVRVSATPGNGSPFSVRPIQR